MGRTKFTAMAVSKGTRIKKEPLPPRQPSQRVTKNLKIVHARQFRHEDLINHQEGVTRTETFDGACICPFKISWRTGETGLAQRCKIYTHICRPEVETRLLD